jgi:hypothetical protein
MRSRKVQYTPKEGKKKAEKATEVVALTWRRLPGQRPV